MYLIAKAVLAPDGLEGSEVQSILPLPIFEERARRNRSVFKWCAIFGGGLDNAKAPFLRQWNGYRQR
jgi:hypothetical protein